MKKIGSILLTGASGFLGKEICKVLKKQNREVFCVQRSSSKEFMFVEGITAETDWTTIFLNNNISEVVHAAARAHVMSDKCSDPFSEFRKVNTFGTLNLAKQAAEAGAKRFIFISSIKVNGEFTKIDNKFTADDRHIPADPYGLSKYEAEIGLKKISEQTGMEVVIIRPPLIYGPNVKANFRSMLKWVNRGVLLPFGSINNKRSLISLTNLVDFINVCINHPNAANQTFLISDGADVSTTNLLQQIAKAFNKKAKLVPMPVSLMKLAAKLIGKKDIADRVFGNLQIDSSKARNLLDWKPVVTMEEELKMTVEAFLNE